MGSVGCGAVSQVRSSDGGFKSDNKEICALAIVYVCWGGNGEISVVEEWRRGNFDCGLTWGCDKIELSSLSVSFLIEIGVQAIL